MSDNLQELVDALPEVMSNGKISLVAFFDEDGNIDCVFDTTLNTGKGFFKNDGKYPAEPAKRDPDSLDKNGHPDNYLKEPVDLTLLKIAPFEVLVYKGSKRKTIHAQGNLLPHP